MFLDLLKGARYADEAVEIVQGADNFADEIPLFRAVSPDELSDIEATGAFRNPPGIEKKYFSTTEDGARQYARMAEEAFDDPAYAFVSTSIRRNGIEADLLAEVDMGISTVLVPTAQLDELATPIILGD